jgi:hypothetical protein
MNSLISLQYEILLREEIKSIERRLLALQEFMDAQGISRRGLPRQFGEGAVPDVKCGSHSYGKD